MTDSGKVRAYYATFNEWDRLSSPEGSLEFARALTILDDHLLANSRILDLGGGPGRYTIALAKRGHRVVLADLSPALLDQARARIAELGLSAQVESVDEVNAEDLGRYPDDSFDGVLAFGPFYHLVSEPERARAAREIGRVLKPSGLAFVAFVPRLTGVTGLIERAAHRREQVTPQVLRDAATSGVFRNASSGGFQEGYYPQPGELEALFGQAGFEVLTTVSLRSVGHRVEKALAALDGTVRAEADSLLASLSTLPEVVATSGHALVIARRSA